MSAWSWSPGVGASWRKKQRRAKVIGVLWKRLCQLAQWHALAVDVSHVALRELDEVASRIAQVHLPGAVGEHVRRGEPRHLNEAATLAGRHEALLEIIDLEGEMMALGSTLALREQVDLTLARP